MPHSNKYLSNVFAYRHDNDGLHIGHHGTRAGRRLEDVNAVSGVLHLNRQQQVPQSDVPARLNDGRRFPQKGAVSEQVAHSPTLYFSTANKEEEGRHNNNVI